MGGTAKCLERKNSRSPEVYGGHDDFGHRFLTEVSNGVVVVGRVLAQDA